jgi:Fe-S-cluster-containing dehydrogenase component/formate-dependent nitrite reductase membrane component NrfD
MAAPVVTEPANPLKWAKAIDNTKCIGCHACTTACKSENEVPLGVTRTYVKYVDVGVFPQAHRAFQVTRCNQCEDAPCVTVCPTAAMHQRDDGIVDFNKAICIGCKACIAACPYDAIFINPEDHSAEKCNFCAHRIDVGLEPACVVVCPTQAILVGDLNDPTSGVARLVDREPVTVRRPEKGTRPKLFYKGARQVTLDPIAAARPEGGIFMWSEQATGTQNVVSGHPGVKNSSAAAILSYDVQHKAPWDWRVSAYTWTKGIAAGAYLVPLLILMMGGIGPDNPLWVWVAPILAGVGLAATGVLLIWDLEHPERFYMLFTHAQWSSWLVRGGFIIGAYSAVLGLHFLGSVLDMPELRRILMLPGFFLAVMTSVYTAYLFAQSKGRDMWQNPLLVPHLLIQSLMLGAAMMLIFAPRGPSVVTGHLTWMLQLTILLHLALVIGEVSMPHPTAHAKLATHEMIAGRFGGFFWVGMLMVTVGLAAPWLGVAVVPFVAIGLFAHEHAWVQAGQAVPLA